MNLEPRIRKHTRRTPEKLRQLLADYQNSGLNQREFAHRIGMGYSNFIQWLGQARKLEASTPAPAAASFVPVVLGASPASSTYQLCWPGGLCLRLGRGFDPAELRQLLACLPPCSH